jgi:pSer/pThr/pTyr-binding forkhead associated (FHA) protein
MVETGFDANASGQTGTQKQVPVAPVRDDVTRVIMHEAPPVAESPKTQILQLALGYLEVTGGANKGERVPIGLTGKSVIVIGRDADPAKGDLKITSAYVSRKHAEVKIDADGTITLTDLGSASGTKIDGVRLAANEARKIEPGIEIMIADVPVKVLRADAV